MFRYEQTIRTSEELQSGTAASRNYFFPFDGNRGGTAFSELTTKRFTGQYHETSLPGGEGLSYYGARWYDAKLGRFLSADTIVPGDGLLIDYNRYGYARGNPLKFNDPSRHCATLNSGEPDQNYRDTILEASSFQDG